MKSLIRLLQCVLADASTWCCASTTRDWKTISGRLEDEGLSFLTITLPTFSADFERCLAEGYVVPGLFCGFRKRGALPVFLRGLLERVFDRCSGVILDIPCHESIYFVRQITLMCKKIELPCTPKRVQMAFDKYVECEHDIHEWERMLSRLDRISFAESASILFGPVLHDIDRKIYNGEHVPKHSSGSTADRVLGNAKYLSRNWPERLEEYFPIVDFCLPNSSFFEELEAWNIIEPVAEMPVKVITVPKTLKTPRIIAMEPVYMQYVQQGLLELIVPALEGSDYLSNSLGFTDQSYNQFLAQTSSMDGSLATLDLSEASDRVSNLLVKMMLRNFPSLSGAVQSCRSTRANVPGYEPFALAKFASMGSAMCFPIEAMVFLTIIFDCWRRSLMSPPSRRDIKSFLGTVRIYGDDIIIPVELARPVTDHLQLYGMKVNAAKSFSTGKFRESCGGEYYDGSDVKPVRLTRMLPQLRSDASAMASTVSFRNQLYQAGLWQSVRFLDDVIGGLAPFPIVADTSPALGRFSFLPYQGTKWDGKYQKPLVRALILKSRPPVSKLDGHDALLKYFLKRGQTSWFEPIEKDDHLERYGRPRSVDTKIAWVSPF